MQLTAEEKENIAVLTAQGLTPNAVGKALHRDRKTVVSALKEPQSIERVEHLQLLLADKLQEKAEMLLDAVTPESFQKMNALQLMTSIGIATDKIRTIRGLSNQNIAVKGVTIVTSCKELTDLLAEGN